jgi:predicted extracellular nuclease
MNSDLINIYIENLLNEISEGAKSRVLLQTQLKYTELLNNQLQAKVTELETQLQSQQEKLNKKKSKEVNTLDEQF